MNRAQAAATHARAFVAEAARAPRGATVLRALDWSTGEAREIELPLDPAKGAREQIDAIFKRARRLKEGAAIAGARLDDATASSERLRALRAALSSPGADPEAIVAAARAAAPRDFKLSQAAGPAAANAGAPSPRPPYRRFIGATGAAILVGRNAQHNDALTLRVARPWDSWLHAKNRAGAHVVVPLQKGASLPADVLVEAAHLAAHFSDASEEAVVEVTYTPRRYIRKPRGSAPGAVVVDREKVIVLRRDEAILRRLLASEVEEEGQK
jgi:predicted ribosome quality control (RQC) complex YloA/Tae2 family protein